MPQNKLQTNCRLTFSLGMALGLDPRIEEGVLTLSLRGDPATSYIKLFAIVPVTKFKDVDRFYITYISSKY